MWDATTAEPPGSLYKYYSSERIGFLSDRLVCFSTLEQLNDPFEGISLSRSVFPEAGPGSMQARVESLDMKREAYRRIFERAIASGMKVEDANKLARQVAENDELTNWIKHVLVTHTTALARQLPISHLDFEAELTKTAGVFCLSEDPFSAPMWAHYARQYSGFVVEFDTSHEFFRTNDQIQLRKVLYELHIRESMIELGDTDFLRRKAPDWAYEKEWRTLHLLEDATVKTDNGFHLFEVPRDAVKAIILGQLCSAELVVAAKKATLQHGWPTRKVHADRLNKVLVIDDLELR